MAETAVQGFRLSPQQRRLWTLAKEAEGSPYRAEAVVRITGPLDRARLETALGEVVARHEILRTVFPVPPGMSQPAQVIQPPEPVRLADAPGPLRPDEEPPFAAALFLEGPESHHLLLTAHAFVADAAALEVIVRDLARAYAGRLEDEPPAQYADVAEALNELLESEETEAGRELWREEGTLPAGDDSSPFRPQWISLRLETSAPAATLLAAWRTLLWRLGLPGEAIGVEYPGRHYEGFDTAAGPFARFLPVRLPVADGLSFGELADRAAARLAELEDWQDYFFPQGGFLPAGFRFAEPADPEPAGPVRFEIESVRGWTERFELLLSARGLVLELGYDAARFTEEEAHRILEAFRAVLENVEPADRLGDVELTRPEERERLLRDLAGPEIPIPSVPVHRLILEQSPDAVALSGEDGLRVTYEELAGRVRQLAVHLQSLGVGLETRVGLCAERSPEMIVGLLAILEAGGAWVPLDPSYPAARLEFMLGDSKAPVLLIQDHLRGRLEASGVEVVLLAEDGSGEARNLPDPHPESAAYVLYTSGSTGTPKGVVVRHRALTNQSRWMLDAYPLGPGHRVLQKTPSSFDASVWEILAPLAAGAELVLAAPGAHRDPVEMGRVLREREVTSLQVVPALLRLLLDGGYLEGCPSLARLFCGGEPLTEDLRARVHRLSDRIELINLYGPTETTVQVASWVAERRASDRAVPVGRPVHNARLYLLDPWGKLVPEGFPGEIWIGGVAPARGYLDRPDQTAESFRPDPFSGEPGARMYRSGDLGRLRADGALEFLGRIGGQNKVRGYRFDPGEIEAVLRAHGSVRDAAVLVRGDRLVAYVVPREGTPSLQALRPFLAERLPDYLVPTDLVVLSALPLSPSGKVDRSALPASGAEEISAPAEPAAPRTPLEEILAEIWAGLLGRERVGVYDDFFELGGHSLLGAQLVARVRDALGVEISLRNVFEAPTVAGLAARVEEAWRGEGPAAPPLVPVPRVPGEGLPLSFAQQRLWFLDRLAPGSAYYNVPSAVRFTGDLDERALGAAFNEIVRVHESLRTTFHAVDGRPMQMAAPALVLPLPVADLSVLPAALREAEALRLAEEEARRPFDLSRGPLARLTLLRLGEGERVLLTTLHHIVSDAWSVGVLYRSLLALYAAFAEGRPSPLVPPPVQYADYAVWQRERFAGEAWDRELSWWAGRLADLPVLQLPADRPRPPRQTFRGAGIKAELPADLAARLRAVARERGATLFMVLLAGFQALLSRITGQEEIVLGSPVANRERSEVEGLIGFFVNTLVLRTDASGNPAFADLVGRARETALGAWAHQSLPFERLVEELQPERDLSRQPLFQVMFHLQNVPLPDFGIPG
ncbi:MAG TPA: amino acid adenylation domain-containing protein, partial [Thermoanaerobaculia bacterium]|nr:amino acid adenylation domain-containing protein [Thermoanaerobaculia bacterium]